MIEYYREIEPFIPSMDEINATDPDEEEEIALSRGKSSSNYGAIQK